MSDPYDDVRQHHARADRRAAALYERLHGRPPQWVAVAPGRVNLIGEHTDYSEGYVLPMALQWQTAVAAGAAPGRTGRLRSTAFPHDDAVDTIDLTQPIVRSPTPWMNYGRGVLAGFQQRGVALSGFDAVVDSDVPPGGGLSSSAALEVAIATMAEAAFDHAITPREKARLCQRADHDFVGVPSGIMDHLISAMATAGHALLIDCRSLETDAVPFDDPALAILVVNTNVRHEHSSGEYAKRGAECAEAARLLGVRVLRDATPASVDAAAHVLPPLLHRRARHVVTENARTLAAAHAMRRGDWDALGQLLYAGHASLRDDFEVSCEALDIVVAEAARLGRDRGVYGARMTGGGFGGSVVCLVRADDVAEVGDAISTAYEARSGRSATTLVARAGGGADIVRNAS